MNILIIEATSKRKPLAEDYSDTSIVHCRNSLILKNALAADLLDGEYFLPEVLKKQYDVIICCYASPYMPHVPYRQILEKNPKARYIWLVNDHDVEDNQLLRWGIQNMNLSYDMICNNPREGYRHWILNKNISNKKLNDFINKWLTVNLNSLIMDDSKIPVDFSQKNGVVYYGTYRKWRAESFKKFLTEGVFLSASNKNWKKFQALGCNCNYIPKLEWQKNNEDLRKFKYSIYMEDEHTHTHYAFLANRFYEALMSDAVMLFDADCANTIKKCGYAIPEYLILDDEKLKNGVVNYAESLAFQTNLMYQQTFFDQAMHEKRTTVEQIKQFIK
ncbi:MAG: hypothetical protein FJX80_00205 [Bacteroidetes bacterium]|nr:hypothetical protein [Bacteroidota bacterium]